MKVVLLAVIASVCVFVPVVIGQRCPSSTRKMTIFVPNGEVAKNLRYELLPVQPKNVASQTEAFKITIKNLGLEERAAQIRTLDSAIELEYHAAKRFLATYDPARYETVEHLSGNKPSGLIPSGVLELKISDLISNYFLIKFTSDNFEPAFYFGNLLGGCDERDRIIIDRRLGDVWPTKK